MSAPRLPPHHVESARAHLVRDVLTARPDEALADVRARLVAGPRYHHGAVWVVEDGGVVGWVPLEELLEPGEAVVGVRMRPVPEVAHLDDDQEHVAGLAVRHGLPAVPVVDDAGRLQGIVPPLALLRILRREHVEDLHRLAGIERESEQVRASLTGAPARRARHRLPWLLVGLLGSGLSAVVMSAFEAELAADLRVAFFVPGIVYLADAIGTQTEAIAVRGLSLSGLSLRDMMWGEVVTGTIIGLCLAALAWPLVVLGYGDPPLATAVSASILAAGTVASGIGLMLPWLLQRARVDPAFGSGPVATILQDVLSIAIFLGVATAIG